MNNQWVQIIGTLLIGGGLLNWVIPLYFSIFGMCSKPDETNEFCITLGGKIHRKWFFLNNLIYFAVLCLLLLLAFVFKNWVMFLILLPFFFANFILYWGNVYKRINAIIDNHKFAIFLTIALCTFCIASHYLYSKYPRIEIPASITILLIWLLIFIVPSKNKNEVL